MEDKKVRFYFAYNSPYAFLANTRIHGHLAPLGAEVEYRPVYSPRTAGAPDLSSPRLSYIFEDVGRFAEAYELQLRPGPFADSQKACLGFFVAEACGRGREYHDGVYGARWLEAKDIGHEETLAEIAERAGLDRRAFQVALGERRYEAALGRSNEDAKTDGVFGFPFFVYRGKRFWGNDRIEWLVREMTKG
jgi:2-hydroxychromene-2-carboxylate isomerase